MRNIDRKDLENAINEASLKRDWFATYKLIFNYIEREQKYLIEKYVTSRQRKVESHPNVELISITEE